ncbi:MAG TPA: hypothetical protein VE621_17775 [Bryobacteraceae bacterium]|jgi:hypothetical protein|nr:hypothetical protein [Bryobacteraceae bacterium]
MRRRHFVTLLLIPTTALLGTEADATRLRGKLVPGPALQLADGSSVKLLSDDPTRKVLEDKRLAGADFEVLGERVSGSEFRILPNHQRALFTYKNNQRLMVTYWCDVCYIRTYSPGVCWCCQDETRLDLIDPDKVDRT